MTYFIGYINNTVIKLPIYFNLTNKINKLGSRIEEQQIQYSRRTSLRFNNVQAPTNDHGEILKPIDTDALVLKICNTKLRIPHNIKDIGRSHPIDEVKNGKISIITRFLTYRQRHMVFSHKKKLKGHPDNISLTKISLDTSVTDY